jgi:hypothetical protein
MKPKNETKPKPPYKGFPLVPHANGQWYRYFPGVGRKFFGPWRDPDAALERFKREFPYLHAGLEPPTESLSLSDLYVAYDNDRKTMLDTGRIKQRSYDELMAVARVVRDTLGATCPVDKITPLSLKAVSHKLAVNKKGEATSPVSHKRKLTYARMLFRFANEMLDCKVKYKEALKSPEKRLLRERRTAAGAKMFTAEELRSLLLVADARNEHAMCAVIYLGLFAGFGPTDCIHLTVDKVRGEFLEFPRPKTGISRKCWLPAVARDAIRASAEGPHVLNGRVWNRHVLAREFRKLCEASGIYSKGRTEPYSLRRTLETVAKNAEVNQSVIERVMGHERPDMSEVYNQKVFDKQLRKLGEFIERWLEGSETL